MIRIQFTKEKSPYPYNGGFSKDPIGVWVIGVPYKHSSDYDEGAYYGSNTSQTTIKHATIDVVGSYIKKLQQANKKSGGRFIISRPDSSPVGLNNSHEIRLGIISSDKTEKTVKFHYFAAKGKETGLIEIYGISREDFYAFCMSVGK